MYRLSKLSEVSKRDLYRYWLDTGETLKNIGLKFGISQATVSKIISHGIKGWKE